MYNTFVWWFMFMNKNMWWINYCFKLLSHLSTCLLPFWPIHNIPGTCICQLHLSDKVWSILIGHITHMAYMVYNWILQTNSFFSPYSTGVLRYWLLLQLWPVVPQSDFFSVIKWNKENDKRQALTLWLRTSFSRKLM